MNDTYLPQEFLEAHGKPVPAPRTVEDAIVAREIAANLSMELIAPVDAEPRTLHVSEVRQAIADNKKVSGGDKTLNRGWVMRKLLG